MALEIFDLAVNIFQSIFVSYYLVECLGVKNKNINKIITYMTGFMVTLVYLEIIRYKTDFESFGIFIYLFISMMFSIVMLGGTIAEKAFYNILLLGIIVFSASKPYRQNAVPPSPYLPTRLILSSSDFASSNHVL